MRDHTALESVTEEIEIPTAGRGFVDEPVEQTAPATGLRILYSGPLDGTSLQRAERLRDLSADFIHVRSGLPTVQDPTFQFHRVANRIKRHPDFYLANSRLLKLAERSTFDIVWIDKGLWLRPRTLRRLRQLQPNARFIAHSCDDMINPENQSARYLEGVPLYDLHVTTKSYNISELEALGARSAIFLDNSYDPEVHRPVEPTAEERERLGAEVGFIGGYEDDRAQMMLRLAQAGIPVTVRGPEWGRMMKASHPNLRILDDWMDSHDYPRSLAATRINLGFLRKCNRDLQTTRSVEIPACRSFMLAERTDEHQRLFREGVEAEFFGDFDELVKKCRFYLANENERLKIAERGHRRCVRGGYTYEQRIRGVVEAAMSLAPQQREEAAPLAFPELGIVHRALASASILFRG